MFDRRQWRWTVVFGLALAVALAPAGAAVKDRVKIAYDQYHVPTIRAKTERDTIVAQGYLHANDRFFQMDTLRRTFSGTLSELVGGGAIPQDVQLRTLGLRRAAEASMAVQPPEVIDWLEAYSEGVNAWLNSTMYGKAEDDDSCSGGSSSSGDSLSESSVSSDESWDGHSAATSSDARSFDSDDSSAGPTFIVSQLPPEYGALQIDHDGIPAWTPLDSLTVAKGLAFGLSFDLSDIDRTLALLTFVAGLGQAPGLQMIQSDLYRAQPFDTTASIPTEIDFTPVDVTGLPDVANMVSQHGTGDEASAFGRAGRDPGNDETLPAMPDFMTDPDFEAMLINYRETLLESPVMAETLEGDPAEQGSNWWIAKGAKTASGYPMLANDPHLSLGTPATFYENHLISKIGDFNVTGISFPGVPGVALGCNRTACWGATVNRLDVTDVYQEVLLALTPDPTVLSHTFRADGPPEAMQFIAQTFFVNAMVPGVNNVLVDAGVPASSGGVTLVVPRHGPIVSIQDSATSPSGKVGLSVQYTGFYPTTELEAFRRFSKATTPQEFQDALQFFDVGSQNWSYADINGNIAYWTSAEIPLRQDLQNLNTVDGVSTPFLIRDGTGTFMHDWLALSNPQPNQSVPYEILPFDEMPQAINPADDLVYNCNNDPIGTTFDNSPLNQARPFGGLYYLSSNYAQGFRQGRLKQILSSKLDGGGSLTLQDYKDMQGDNVLRDAQFFVQEIIGARDRALTYPIPEIQGLAQLMTPAVDRLAAWDFSTPTGIVEGYDPGDGTVLPQPTQDEIDNSVAATIYALWRGQLIDFTIDGTLGAVPAIVPCNGGGTTLAACAPGSSQTLSALKRLFETYSTKGGKGLSGVNFFNVPASVFPPFGIPDGPGLFDNFIRRDLIVLASLQSALGLAASDEFAPAFNNSTNLDDYRWGKLHRIVFEHILGGPFNIPPDGGPGNLAADLPGFSRAGGLGALDASAHSARADELNEFMFNAGPSRRVIATMTPDGPDVLQLIPGGQSGVLGSPHQTDQLELWLRNDYKPLPVSFGDSMRLALTCQQLRPSPPGGQSERIGIERRMVERGSSGRFDRVERSDADEFRQR